MFIEELIRFLKSMGAESMNAGRSRKGMTLVELLIVIVIIGILASMLLLVALDATSRAHATRIVSDLESLREACLIHFSDEGTWPDSFANLKSDISTGHSPEDLNEKGYLILTSGDFRCVAFDISRTSGSIRKCMGRMSRTWGILFTPNSHDLDCRDDLSYFDGNYDSGFLVKVFSSGPFMR